MNVSVRLLVLIVFGALVALGATFVDAPGPADNAPQDNPPGDGTPADNAPGDNAPGDNAPGGDLPDDDGDDNDKPPFELEFELGGDPETGKDVGENPSLRLKNNTDEDAELETEIKKGNVGFSAPDNPDAPPSAKKTVTVPAGQSVDLPLRRLPGARAHELPRGKTVVGKKKGNVVEEAIETRFRALLEADGGILIRHITFNVDTRRADTDTFNLAKNQRVKYADAASKGKAMWDPKKESALERMNHGEQNWYDRTNRQRFNDSVAGYHKDRTAIRIGVRLKITPELLKLSKGPYPVKAFGLAAGASPKFADVAVKGVSFGERTRLSVKPDPILFKRTTHFIPFELKLSADATAAIRRTDVVWRWLYFHPTKGWRPVVYEYDAGKDLKRAGSNLTRHRFYVTLRQAKETPLGGGWTNKPGHELNPWADLLDIICDAQVAGGTATDTAACERLEAAIHKIVQTQFYSQVAGKAYDRSGNSQFWTGNPTKEKVEKGVLFDFLFESFLEDQMIHAVRVIQNPKEKIDRAKWNCYDLAAAMTGAARALGIDLDWFKAELSKNGINRRNRFRDPAGVAPSTGVISFHAWCVLGAGEGKVYDPLYTFQRPRIDAQRRHAKGAFTPTAYWRLLRNQRRGGPLNILRLKLRIAAVTTRDFRDPLGTQLPGTLR